MKTKELNPQALYWASFNRFELRLPGQCVIDCSHSGQCDDDVEAWIDRVRKQIASDDFPNKPTPELIREELREYGAWDDEELANDEQNFRRIVWLAAGSISDDDTPDCSDPINGDLPLEHVAEYDGAAQWCAERGLKGECGDALPPGMATDGALKYISADPEAFQRRVREFAYALSMRNVNL